jgi:hypothetical protein
MGETSVIEVVRFHGDAIQAVRGGDEQVWIVVKRVCEALGVDESRQRKKLASKAWAVTDLKSATALDGKNYESFCLSLDSLPMWLATIEPARVKPDARAKLIAYQRECARVLRDHFFGRRDEPTGLSASVLEVVLAHQAQMLTLVQTLLDRLDQPTLQHGAITRSGHSVLRSFVRRIADTEASVGKWKSQRAARADVDRELREATAWGGKAKPWHLLPAQLEQPAMAVLRRRLCDAERLAGRNGQLGLFGKLS